MNSLYIALINNFNTSTGKNSWIYNIDAAPNWEAHCVHVLAHTALCVCVSHKAPLCACVSVYFNDPNLSKISLSFILTVFNVEYFLLANN